MVSLFSWIFGPKNAHCYHYGYCCWCTEARFTWYDKVGVKGHGPDYTIQPTHDHEGEVCPNRK